MGEQKTAASNGRAESNLYEIVQPRAAAMIESLRSFGYSLSAAVADLVDNSISAGGRNIWLNFFWNGSDSFISVMDDGRGMTQKQLTDAMRMMVRDRAMYGQRLVGKRYDIGDTEGFLRTNIEFALKHKQVDGALRKYIKALAREL